MEYGIEDTNKERRNIRKSLTQCSEKNGVQTQAVPMEIDMWSDLDIIELANLELQPIRQKICTPVFAGKLDVFSNNWM